ncbi:hypothetical protein MAPG_02168 [Magnaporthiopsis poae ATCC 64411]|uniref:Uncharacterized protein n=1 Tax=Magnaporthiopsis poae (strain ATCC 64411 / 73-15) TaxID=644358 RepID=A0A0C4DQM5_MAGP6|nr:hypothetical protein MAPG_02168 [Magnaporthiopsis poae ATCC 64411]
MTHAHAAMGGEEGLAAGNGGAGLAAGYGAVEHGGVMGQQQQARREDIDTGHDFVGGGHGAGGAGGGWPTITAQSSSTGGMYDWAEGGPSVAVRKGEGVEGYNHGS